MRREKNPSFIVEKSRYWSRPPPFYEMEVATEQKGGNEKNKLVHGNALTCLKRYRIIVLTSLLQILRIEFLKEEIQETAEE